MTQNQNEPNASTAGDSRAAAPEVEPMGVWTVDAAGRTLTINRRMTQWLTSGPERANDNGRRRIPESVETWLGPADTTTVNAALAACGSATLIRRIEFHDAQDAIELRLRFEAWDFEAGRRTGLTITATDRLESIRRTQADAQQSELSALTLRLSNEFIRASAAEIERAIEVALGLLGRFANASSCYLFEFDSAMTSSSKRFEWRAQNVPSTLAAFAGLTPESMPALFPRAAAGETLRVNHLGELGEAEAAERAKLKKQSIGAFICLPVQLHGRVVGLLGFDQHGGGRVWTDEEELALRLSTEMFAQALDRSRAHNRLAFHVNNAPLGVVEWDENWRAARWSPMAEKMFGWPANEVIGRNWDSWHFVHPDDTKKVTQATQRLTEGTDRSNVIINRNFTKDGQTVTCEWFNSVLLDPNGKVVSILSFVQDITSRQRDQNALAASRTQLETLNAELEERVEQRTTELHLLTEDSDEQARTLQAILDAGDDHVLLLDNQQRCLYVSRALLGDLSRSAGSIIGLTPTEASLPETFAQLLSHAAKKALNQGQTIRRDEFNLLTARGTLSFEYIFTPIADAEGQPHRVLCTGHDITERLRAAVAVRESEVRYRTLAEHATDVISCHDTEGRLTYVSPVCRRLLGYEPQELLGQSPDAIAHPDDRDALIQSVARLRLTTDVVSTTFRARRKDGQTIWLEASSRNDGGEIVVVSRDVTSRLDTEQRLRLIQSAVEHVGESVTITDNHLDRPGPHIVYVNPAFTIMTGYQSQEALGCSPRILQGPKSDQEVLSKLHRCLSQGQTFFGETVNYRKDGSEYLVEWHINPLFDRRGNITHWVAIQRDITQRRIAEDLARVHREELAHVTRLSVMGEMASGLAHEINQPLAAINNYANGALRHIDNQSASITGLAETLHHVADQSDRAGQIIRRLRAFVMKRGTHRSPEHVNELIKETLALLDADIRQHLGRVRLDLAPDAQLPMLRVDGIQIEQVLVNIIRNALEAMHLNEPECRQLVITTRRDDHESIHITLADRGPGLTASQRDHLFDPFFTTKDDGMGMGLTISQSIIQAHDGRLWVTPNPAGQGSVFHVTLPITHL